MCDPVTIGASVAMGASVAGGVTNIIGQNTNRQMAKGVENQKRLAQEDAITLNRQRATEDYLRQVHGERLQEAQQHEAVNEKSGDITRQADATAATAVASAAERGVGGRSITQIVNDYHFQSGLEINRIRTNQSWNDTQHEANIAGYRDQRAQRIADMKPYMMQPQAPVDYFGPIFGIAKSGGQIAMAGGFGK